MAPAKTTTRKKTTSTFKQQTLGFSSAKRTSSISINSKAKPKKETIRRTNSTPVAVQPESSSEEEQINDIDEGTLSEEDDSTEEQDWVEEKGGRTRFSSTKKARSLGNATVEGVFRSRDGYENSASNLTRSPVKSKGKATESNLDLQDKEGRWTKHYGVVREKMGNLAAIHSDGQTKIHHILRVFDLSYEYGPCIGVTRLERWERAAALGLDPPSEVREILSTSQGVDEFAQSVFYNEV